MAADKPKQKKQNSLITYFTIFILGFLAGVGFTVYKTAGTSSNTVTASSQQSNTQDEETHEAILNLEGEVTTNPDNFQAWKQLGNLYYDHNEPEKAVEAYVKSLELHSGDANLLTDLGVMYRRIKQPHKALEFFDKAIDMDPNHEPARFNKAIVYRYDLNNPDGAIASLEELLSINPQARAGNGELISDFVASIKAEKQGKK